MFDFKVNHGLNTVARLDCDDFIFTCRFYCGKYHYFNLRKPSKEQEQAVKKMTKVWLDEN